jgi:hypothetical protein
MPNALSTFFSNGRTRCWSVKMNNNNNANVSPTPAPPLHQPGDIVRVCMIVYILYIVHVLCCTTFVIITYLYGALNGSRRLLLAERAEGQSKRGSCPGISRFRGLTPFMKFNNTKAYNFVFKIK